MKLSDTNKTNNIKPRCSSISNQDILSLYQYIQNVSTKIENINSKLFQVKGNTAIKNVNINKSENDDETHTHSSSNSVNPYKRNHSNIHQSLLSSCSFLKDKLINLSLLNQSLLNDDSFKDQSNVRQKTNKTSNEKMLNNHQLKSNTNKNFCCKGFNNKQYKTTFLPLVRKGFKLKTKVINNKNILTVKTLSKVKEELNLMSKANQKNAILNSNVLNDSIELTRNNNKKVKQNVVIQSTKDIMNKQTYLPDNIELQNNYTHRANKMFNDTIVTEMLLLLAEDKSIKTFKSNAEIKCNNDDNYINKMKCAYLIRNNDFFKTASFNDVYIKDKFSQAVIFIQRFWRKWKIQLILSCQGNYKVQSFLKQTMKKEELMRVAKTYYCDQIFNQNVNYKEMILMLEKAKECYKSFLVTDSLVYLKHNVLINFEVCHKHNEMPFLSNLFTLLTK